MESIDAIQLVLGLIGTICNAAALVFVIKKYSFKTEINRIEVLSNTVTDLMCCLVTVMVIIFHYSIMTSETIYGLLVMVWVLSAVSRALLWLLNGTNYLLLLLFSTGFDNHYKCPQASK